MFGRKAKRIAELEKLYDLERVARINAEALLYRARQGDDEETNAFFRAHPVYVEPEPTADKVERGKLSKPSSKKAK